MTKVEKALELKRNKKYSCSQSVGCVYCEEVHMEEKDMLHLMSGFGIGMGGFEGTCGAVSAGVAVIGLLMGAKSEEENNKVKVYKVAKEYTRRFKEKNKSLICKELKGIETGEFLRSCDGCVEDAVEILEEMRAEGLV